MKSFIEQQYSCTITVFVQATTWDASSPGLCFTDKIKGLNPGHALHLARLNWPNADIIIIA